MGFSLKKWIRTFSVCALVLFVDRGYPETVPADASAALSVESRLRARETLDQLDLSVAQKSEIQSILLAATQTMEVVNAQLAEFESVDDQSLSDDARQMRAALYNRRIQLAELLTVEILALLSAQQRAKLDLRFDALTVENDQQKDMSILQETEI